MRQAAMIALLIVLCSTSVVYGSKKNSLRPADVLANEVMTKAIYQKTAVVARAKECHLHISFQTVNAAFDLPLRGTKVVLTDNEDGIIVMNRNMTRTIRGRSPEVFERLTLRFSRDNIKPMLKRFDEAIMFCSKKG